MTLTFTNLKDPFLVFRYRVLKEGATVAIWNAVKNSTAHVTTVKIRNMGFGVQDSAYPPLSYLLCKQNGRRW